MSSRPSNYERINFIVLAALAFSWALLAAPLPAQFAYATNVVDNTVSAYIIDCDGYLSPVSGSPFPTGAAPGSIAITK
jgi:hypothetical protein